MMADAGPHHPQVIVIAGPNGAGKSSTAPALLQLDLEIMSYVNADAIARGMNAFAPETVAFEAGRVMLERIRTLTDKRETFAFETTLSGRAYAHHIDKWIASGYEVNLLYVWLSSPEIAVSRVADRVRLGGHSIPEDTVRERYRASVGNLVELYLPRCTRWMIVDNSTAKSDVLRIAEGGQGQPPTILDADRWNIIQQQASASQ